MRPGHGFSSHRAADARHDQDNAYQKPSSLHARLPPCPLRTASVWAHAVNPDHPPLTPTPPRQTGKQPPSLAETGQNLGNQARRRRRPHTAEQADTDGATWRGASLPPGPPRSVSYITIECLEQIPPTLGK